MGVNRIGKFPGPRGLTSMDFEPPPLEIPFLANGAAINDLYPMDIDKGFDYLTDSAKTSQNGRVTLPTRRSFSSRASWLRHPLATVH